MLEVFDKSRKRIGILENAFDIVTIERLNMLDTLKFSLPGQDSKNSLCQGFNLVRYDEGEYFRIVKLWEEEEERDVYTYEAEHVIALLLNKSMFGYIVIGNIGVYTSDVLRYILNHQSDWKLVRCDFNRQFEYGWEQENLYSALLSVPNRFVDKYMLLYDTKKYPYEVSLVKLDENARPIAQIRRGYNRIRLSKRVEWTKIVTRLYPLGAGEGINQINISDVNGGHYYIQAPQSNIDKYGLIEYIWTDRRYTDAQSLLEASEAMLDELQEPYVEYEVDFIADAKLGDIVEIVGETRDFIVEIETRHSENNRRYYKIANKPYDVASALADVQDRQRIEMVYSQGATQIYADSIAENADSSHPAELRFFIVEDMPIINAIKCKIRLSAFRAYGSATTSGGSVQTSSSGGGQTGTSGGGGGTSTSSGSGGQSSVSSGSSSAYSTQSATSGFDFQTSYANSGYHNHLFPVPQHSHLMDHWHYVTISNHTHTINLYDHTHSITIPYHTHTVDTTHSHSVSPGIFYFGGATGFTLLINNVNVGFFASTDVELDITQHFIKDGKIPRGSWHVIGIQPNALSRVEIAYNLQGFIQSRGGGTY